MNKMVMLMAIATLSMIAPIAEAQFGVDLVINPNITILNQTVVNGTIFNESEYLLRNGSNTYYGNTFNIGDGGSGNKVLEFDGIAGNDANITWNGTGFEFDGKNVSNVGSITNANTVTYNIFDRTKITNNPTADFSSSYILSVQRNDVQTWIEILNNGGAGKGAFFGMNTNDFELYNFQGGPIQFFTDTSASTANMRMEIQNDGDIIQGPTVVTTDPTSPFTRTYTLSVQNTGGSNWMEILNNGGAGKGAIMGIENSGGAGGLGDYFSLYNYQGGPIRFYTNTSFSTGNLRMEIESDGDVRMFEDLDVEGNLTIENSAPTIYFNETPGADLNWTIGLDANDLTIKSDTANNTAELILDTKIILRPSFDDIVGTAISGTVMSFTPTIDMDSLMNMKVFAMSPKVDLDVGGIFSFIGIDALGTYTSKQALNPGSTWSLFWGHPGIKSATASAPPISSSIFRDSTALTADGGVDVGTVGYRRGFYSDSTISVSNPFLKEANTQMTLTENTVFKAGLGAGQGDIRAYGVGSTLDITEHTTLLSDVWIVAYNSGTINVTTWRDLWLKGIFWATATSTTDVTDRIGVDIDDIISGGAGTEVFTNQYGIRIADLSTATNNYGIYSAMTSGANKRFIDHTSTARSDFGGVLAIEADNTALLIGAAGDASLYYDGTDAIINPKVVGSGLLKVLGSLNVTDNISGNDYYAEMHFHNDTTGNITALTEDIWFNITAFGQEYKGDFLNGFSKPDDVSLQAHIPGRYKVDYSITYTGTANNKYHIVVGMGGIIQLNTETHGRTGTGTDVLSSSGTGFLDLVVDDRVTLMAMNEDSGADITVFSANVNLIRIGDA